jgi:molybdopterin synthase catalytic subunit
MQITLRFFAGVRERLGTGERTLETPANASVRQVRALVNELVGAELAPLMDRSMVMVNQEYAGPDDLVHDGDEVAFIPPVSGGDHVRVHPEPLDAAAISAQAADPGAGALVTFVGTVRDNARGHSVVALDYEAYPAAAEKMLARICDELRERWPIIGAAIEHRTGRLEIGAASVVIAVSSAHRDASFAAAAYAIERIKEIVPIWKKEFYEGGATWIGSERDYQVEIGRIPGDTGAGAGEDA